MMENYPLPCECQSRSAGGIKGTWEGHSKPRKGRLTGQGRRGNDSSVWTTKVMTVTTSHSLYSVYRYVRLHNDLPTYDLC